MPKLTLRQIKEMFGMRGLLLNMKARTRTDFTINLPPDWPTEGRERMAQKESRSLHPMMVMAGGCFSETLPVVIR